MDWVIEGNNGADSWAYIVKTRHSRTVAVLESRDKGA